MDQMKETIKKKQEGVEIIQRSVMFTHQLSGGCAELRLMVDIKAPWKEAELMLSAGAQDETGFR